MGHGQTVVATPGENPAAPTSGATGGQSFSESSVSEPINLNAPQIVPAPEKTAGPLRGPQSAAEPAPQRPQAPGSSAGPLRGQPAVAGPAPQGPRGPDASAGPLRGQQSVAGPALQRPEAPAAVGRVPPRANATAADPPAPVVAGPGTLQVVSRPPGAQVIVDGKTIGKTPLTISDVAAGDHSVQLVLTGFKGWSTTVDVKAGSSTRVAASLEQ